MAINALHNAQQKNKEVPLCLTIFKGFGKKVFNRQSIFKNYEKSFVNQLKKGHSFLSDEQIKTSKLYQKLEKRLQNAIFIQSASIKNHIQEIQNMNILKQNTKFQIKEAKLNMWQLKNQILDLQQLLKQQIQVYQQLAYLQNSQDEEQSQNSQQLSQYQSQEDENELDQQEYAQQQCQEQEELSKPSCSIKYFITGDPSNQGSSQMLSSSNRILSQESQQNDLTILYKRESNKDCLSKDSYKDCLQKQNTGWQSQAFGKKAYSRILNTTKQI